MICSGWRRGWARCWNFSRRRNRGCAHPLQEPTNLNAPGDFLQYKIACSAPGGFGNSRASSLFHPKFRRSTCFCLGGR